MILSDTERLPSHQGTPESEESKRLHAGSAGHKRLMDGIEDALVPSIEWDGAGEGGSRLGGGVYIYRAVLTTEDGEKATGSGKLILLH